MIPRDISSLAGRWLQTANGMSSGHFLGSVIPRQELGVSALSLSISLESVPEIPSSPSGFPEYEYGL